MKDRIIVALDVQTKEDFERLSSNLSGYATYVKVGMELYYTFGPNIIKVLKELGYKVFLDLKIHDIPNTAMKACKTITKLGADMINVHAAGGKEMMVAARLGMEEALKENPKLTRPIIIAVTQLTSSDQEMIEKELCIDRPIHEVVVHYAKMAKAAGLDGVVSSPLEVKLIKDQVAKDFICVTPGIRPTGSAGNDQKRVTTPKEAFDKGSDFIVMGRAITTADVPVKAFDNIVNSL